MASADPKFPGYVTPLLAKALPYLSLWYLWKRCRRADPTDKNRHAKLVEQYIGLWCILIGVHVGVLGATCGSKGAWWAAAAVLPTLRVLDVIQANFVRHILWGEHDEEKRGDPLSVSRIIVLAVANYVELIFAFAVIYASIGRVCGTWSVTCGSTVRDYLYFSGITQLTVGYGDCAPTGLTRFGAVCQGLVGLALTVFIFARFSSFFKPHEVKTSAEREERK